MAPRKCFLGLALILFQWNVGIIVSAIFIRPYSVPTAEFKVLRPKGLRISVPDAIGLQTFSIRGNINSKVDSGYGIEFKGDLVKGDDDKWTLEMPNVFVEKGNVIYYQAIATVADVAYQKNLEYVVGGDEDERLIFNEDFNSLNDSLWSRDVKMPLGPDYEFCVYHNAYHTGLVEIADGILRIKPIILESLYGANSTGYGKLKLAGCTSNVSQECSRHAMSYNILPPVISARLSTKNRFSFKYGKIEIRAKFPEGDWLYPELWLEPLYSYYGANYASGRVLLGFARGNANLYSADDIVQIFDARKLEFGLRKGLSTVLEERFEKIKRDVAWNKDFHVYTTVWTDAGFTFLADNEKIGRFVPTSADGSYGRFDGATAMAPFDREFYVTIGVGVGGVRVFPDKTISSSYEKPWKNVGAKSMLRFWNARNDWMPSWSPENGRKTMLEIDYIKVWSL